MFLYEEICSCGSRVTVTQQIDCFVGSVDSGKGSF